MSDQAKTPAPTPATKKLFIKTYGCQMNVYDSERMAEVLGEQGYEQVDSPEGADMILLNTCHIREKAAEKVYSELGRFRGLKEAKPDLKIGVAGCVAQAEGEEIMRRMPLVDLVVGPQTYHRLPAMVRGEAPAIITEVPEEDKFDHLPAPRATRRARKEAFHARMDAKAAPRAEFEEERLAERAARARQADDEDAEA